MICSSAVLKCWHIVLVIGEITLHFTNLSKFESIGKENLQAFHFLDLRVS